MTEYLNIIDYLFNMLYMKRGNLIFIRCKSTISSKVINKSNCRLHKLTKYKVQRSVIVITITHIMLKVDHIRVMQNKATVERFS